MQSELKPLSAAFLEDMRSRKIARVPGSAVFITDAKDQMPPVMDWHVRLNHALQQYVLVLTMTVVSTPRVDRQERLNLKQVSDYLWRAELAP